MLRRLTLALTLSALLWPSPASAQVVAFDCFPLDAGQEVPPNGSTGRGFGNVWLHVPTGELHWNIPFSGLTGSATSAHFHGPALPGANAGPQVTLSTSSPLYGTAFLSPTQVADVLAGKWYVNIHTSAHTGGEIRGQLVNTGCVQRFEGFGLDGVQVVPPSGSAASGSASLWFNIVNNRIYWYGTHSGLASPLGSAEFRGPAGPGANGGLQVSTSPGSPMDSLISILPSMGDDLMAGLWYLTITTGMHPADEIRGQVLNPGRAQWTDLGMGKPGITGTPAMIGTGPLTGGSANSVRLLNGRGGATANLVYGLSNLSVPFKGGTMVPFPDFIVVGLAINTPGELTLPFIWPVGVPAGVPIYGQFWVQDVDAKNGLAASNGLQLLSQ
jgi:hypothetical protein